MSVVDERCKLGDLCLLISGQHIDAADYNSDQRGIGYLTGPSDFGLRNPIVSKWTERPKAIAKAGDILITVKGSGVGKINMLVDGEVAISRQLMAIRVERALPTYIYALLESRFQYFQEVSTGTAIPGISRDQILSIEVALPLRGEQERIVAILDDAFEGIATAKAHAEQNLRSAMDVFIHQREALLCGDTSWAEAELSSLCDIKHGYAFEGEHFSGQGDHILLTPGSFYEEGGFRDRGDKTKYFTGQIPPAFILAEGDLLVAMTEQAAGLLGSPLLVPESGRYLHNQRLGKVVAKPGLPWRNDFFFHVFNLKGVRREIHDSASGAKVRHTSPGKIGAVKVRYPNSIEVQQYLASRLVDLHGECQRLKQLYERKIAALDELKQSILHQAFSGQL